LFESFSIVKIFMVFVLCSALCAVVTSLTQVEHLSKAIVQEIER
jgi:hypothetical protein